jgi:hypothetical protein
MRKLMMLAAMVVAVAMLVAAPAMADTVLVSGAEIDQSNEGSQYAVNLADQDASASQYQYNPGGSAATGDQFDLDFNVAGNNLQAIEFDVQFAGDATGGAGGTGSQYQYQNQRQVQDATATGPTFSAEQTTDSANLEAL